MLPMHTATRVASHPPVCARGLIDDPSIDRHGPQLAEELDMTKGLKPTVKQAAQIVQERQHARFVRDAIARSLLTLPFAHHSADDPFGTIYGYYKQLMDAATSGALPPPKLVADLVETIREDIEIHESAGNFLKADIERRWSEGLLLHFAIGQEASL